MLKHFPGNRIGIEKYTEKNKIRKKIVRNYVKKDEEEKSQDWNIQKRLRRYWFFWIYREANY